MALYIPHSIFHFARLLYVRPETFGPYYIYWTIEEEWFIWAIYSSFLYESLGQSWAHLFNRQWIVQPFSNLRITSCTSTSAYAIMAFIRSTLPLFV